jgi:hypothetical protein
MKNIIYGIMDLLATIFCSWFIGMIVMNSGTIEWSLINVMFIVTFLWVPFRFIRIHWYIFKTSKIARKSVRKVINR